jgi:hypothetical protein
MARWEAQDPLQAIDAQISILTKARSESTATLINAEQDIVAALAHGNVAREHEARLRATGARSCVRDFTAELDELHTERAQIVPPQRWPLAES